MPDIQSSNDSQLNTLSLPQVGDKNPSTVAYATNQPFRVVVRNIGPNRILLAHDSPTLQNAPATANTYEIPPGQSDVFVLAPKQGLFAAGEGAGGKISIAVSVAFLREL